jgi:DnaK suppressor protein
VNTSADVLDQIQHRQEREMAIGNLERSSTRLSEVRSALDRVRLNTYGICVDCEEEIDMKRLAAVPWTTSCLACREVTERSLKQPSDALEEPDLNAA